MSETSHSGHEINYPSNFSLKSVFYRISSNISKLVVKLHVGKRNTRLSVKSYETANKTAQTAISPKDRTQKFRNKLKNDQQNLQFYILIIFRNVFSLHLYNTNY